MGQNALSHQQVSDGAPAVTRVKNTLPRIPLSVYHHLHWLSAVGGGGPFLIVLEDAI